MAHSKRPSRLDYCQYLLSSQTNYTLTNYSCRSYHGIFITNVKLLAVMYTIFVRMTHQISFSNNYSS
jgi:hypothetical protein